MTPNTKYHVVCHTCVFEKLTDTGNGAAYERKRHEYNFPKHKISAKRIQ